MKADMKTEDIRAEDDSAQRSFSGWGVIFITIVVTAIVVGVVGGFLSSKRIVQEKAKRNAEFRKHKPASRSVPIEIPEERESLKPEQ